MMLRAISPIAVVLFLLLAPYSEAQRPIFRLTTANGLSSNEVNCIAQSRDSLIWIGTQHGLNKFDGMQTAQYFAHDGMFSNAITALCEAADTTLWIGTEQGIDRLKYKTDSFIAPIILPKAISGKVLEIKKDPRNSMWVRTERGIAQFSPSGLLKKSIEHSLDQRTGLLSAKVQAFTIEENGNIWIGTKDQGIDFYNVQQDRLVHYGTNLISQGLSISQDITDLIVDKNGSLWVADNSHSLYKIHLIESSGEQYAPKSQCSIIKSDNNDHIWIYYPQKGLYYYSPQIDSLRPFVTDNITQTTVTDILFSKQNTIWIATQSQGAYIYKNLQSTLFTKLRFSGMDGKCQIMANSFGNYIWLQKDTTISRVAVWFDSNQPFSEPKSKPIQLACKIVNSFSGYAGKLWILGRDSVLRNISVNQTTQCQHLLKSNSPIIAPCYTEKPHIIAQDSTLYMLCQDNLNCYFQESTVLNFEPRFIVEYSNDYLVIGDKSAIIWDSKTKQTLPAKQLDEVFPIYAACISGQGNLLFASNNGIYQADVKNKTIQKPTHLYADAPVFALCGGQANSIIFCTGNALGIINSQNAEVSLFDSNSSLPNVSFSHIELFYKANGTIILNTNEGVYVTNENILATSTQPPEWKIAPADQNSNKTIFFSTKNDAHISDINQDELPIHFLIADKNHTELGTKLTASNGDKILHISDKSVLTITKNDIDEGENTISISYPNRPNHPLRINIEMHTFNAVLWFGLLVALIAFSSLYFYRKPLSGLLFKYIQTDSQEAKIKELYQTKLGFFTEISHEIRTPLTMILDPINQIMKQESLNSYTKDKLISVLENGDKILGLINKLLDYRKLETGSDKLQAQETDIISFTKSIIETFEEVALQKSQRIVFQSTENGIATWIDHGKLKKVIASTIETTLLLTPEGRTITIAVAKSQPKVKLKQQGNAIMHIYNADSETQKKENTAIERFFTYTNKDNPDSAQGLRLVLAKKLAELHKGELNAEKNEDGNFSFTLKLPLGNQHLAKDEMIECPAIDTKAANDDMEDLSSNKKTILLVEDNESVLAYLDTIFLNKYTVFKSDNGREGLEKAMKYLPDIIVSDIMMPEMDGTEMCRKLKANHTTAHIPILLLTAKTFTEDQVEGLEAGADDYITKPFKSEILDLKVKNVLDAAERMRKQMKTDIISKPTEELIESEEDRLMKRLIEYIDQNMSDMDLSVETMSAELGISRAQLFRKTKAILGHTPNDLLKSMRLKRAEQLLKQGNLRISDISFEVGFANPQYFSQSFTKMFGHTPSVYQKLQKD